MTDVLTPPKETVTSVAEIRTKYPQYDDMSDGDLLMGLHRKYYSDLTVEDFLSRIAGTENVRGTISNPELLKHWQQNSAKAGSTTGGTSEPITVDVPGYGVTEFPSVEVAEQYFSENHPQGGKGSDAVGTAAGFTVEQQRALALARARLRKNGGGTQMIDELMGEMERQGLSLADPPILEQPSAPPANKPGRARAAAQGATFALADEAEALVRSAFSEKDYETVLGEVRNSLEQYRKEEPGEALAFEALGVGAPIIASLLLTRGLATPGVLAASARTGRLAPWLLRTLRAGKFGAVEGAAYAFNAGEGGFVNRALDAPAGATLGAIGGAAGVNAASAVGAGFNGLMKFAQRKFGPRAAATVEKEFRRIADDSGLSLDDIVDGIRSGKFPAEIGGNKTMAAVARAYRDESRKAGSILEDAYKGRTDSLREDLMSSLRRELSQTDDPNVIKAVTSQLDDLQREQSAAYNNVFANAAPLGDDVVDELSSAIRRTPDSLADAQKIYRARTGKEPFFRLNKETGEVVFDRRPTLEEAEIVRRAIDGAASREFRTGSGTVGQEIRNVEGGLRGLLDDASPDLAATRQNWASIQSAREAFEEGRKALSRQPDEVAILVEDLAQYPDRLAAYRQGVAAAYRAKGFTGAGKSLPRNLLEEGRKEGAILRVVFPEDKLDDILGKADRAASAMDAEGVIFGGSQTSTNIGRARQNNAGVLATAVDDVRQSGVVGAAFASLLRALKKARPQLSDKEIQQLAKLMVEADPDAFLAAMSGAPSSRAVREFTERQLDWMTPPVTQFARRAAGGVANPMVNPAAEQHVRGLRKVGP
jgi:hypothetical protein